VNTRHSENPEHQKPRTPDTQNTRNDKSLNADFADERGLLHGSAQRQNRNETGLKMNTLGTFGIRISRVFTKKTIGCLVRRQSNAHGAIRVHPRNPRSGFVVSVQVETFGQTIEQ
jgi:hypothetical protein